MRGLDALSPLPGGMGWGAPAALPRSVVALKSLRQSWLGVTGTGRFVRECDGIFSVKTFHFSFDSDFLSVDVPCKGDLEGALGSSVAVFAHTGFGPWSSAAFSPRAQASAYSGHCRVAQR